MKLLISQIIPTNGKIKIDDLPLNKCESNLKRRLGYLPQSFGLYDELTVFEFLDYMCALKGIKNNSKKAIDKAIEDTNLQEKRKSKIRSLSGRQKQRVGIAQVLLGDPELVILDEPTVGLDPEERIKFRNTFLQIAHNKIVLLSTHIIDDIQATCNRIIIINGGKILFDGTSTDLIKAVDGHVGFIEGWDNEDLDRKAAGKYIVTSIILLIFSAIDFYTSVILGISGTAPFSKWSYCKFLCDINSILLMMVMFFCTDFFSNQESKVKEITWFTPMPQRKVWIAKFTAVFVSYFITVLCCIVLSLIYYKITLDFTSFQNFLLPILIILLPSFLLVFGLSVFLGNQSQTLLYIFVPVILLLSLMSFNISPFADIFAKGYIKNTPLIVSIDSFGEPIFYLSSSFIISRCLIALVGIVLYIISLKKVG